MNFTKKICILIGLIICSFCQSLHAGAAQDDFSWRSSMAAMEVAVDSYRLVLRELENVLAQFTEAARENNGDTPEKQEIWRTTMAYSLKGLQNAKSDDLPLLMKLIHENLMQQFEEGAEFGKSGELFTILEGIVTNFQIIGRQYNLYEEFGLKSAGVNANFYDEEEALLSITAAADEVQKVLVALNKAGAEGADSGEKYPLLVKLNTTLKILLERMAAAAQSGVEIGFTPQMVTKEYSLKLSLFNKHLDKVTKLFNALKEPLPPYRLQMTAKCLDAGSDSNVVSLGVGRLITADELRQEEPFKAHVRLQRREMAFEGSSWHEVSPLKTVEERYFSGSEELKDMVSNGRAYEYLAQIGTLAGVYSSTQAILIECPADQLTPPQSITAEAAINGAWAEDFTQNRTFKAYRELDVINISWDLSKSEQLPAKSKHIKGHSLKNYRLYRSISEEEFELVATLPPGTIYYEDRVNLDRLIRSDSVRYQIGVEDQNGNIVMGPISKEVRGAWDVNYEIARNGYFEYTYDEIDLAVSKALELYPEYIVKATQDWLKGIGKELYPAALEHYWARAPEGLKIKWYNDEQKYRFDGDSLCLENGPQHYIERDQKRVITEIWLALQPEFVAMEPARWWQSLANQQREEYLQLWWKKLNPEYRDFLHSQIVVSVKDEMVPNNYQNAQPWEGMTIEQLSAAVVVSWYDSLDSIEQGFLQYFWNKMDDETKRIALIEWWADQKEPYRKEVCFPAFNGLSEAEQAAFIKEGYKDLSDAVKARFLPYVFFEAASWGEKQDVVHHVEDKSRASKRQFLFGIYRPVDVLFGFQFDKVAGGLITLLLILFGLRIYLKKRRRDPFDI